MFKGGFRNKQARAEAREMKKVAKVNSGSNFEGWGDEDLGGDRNYTWEQINQALMNKGLGAKAIVRIMFELNAIHRGEK